MKKIYKTLFIGLAAVTMTSCWNDLDISSIDPQSSPTYDDMQLLAKAYATLGLTGQQGPVGKGDISSDEGESGFYRTTFNLQVLPTDECNWAWQTDTDIPQITGIAWSSSSQRTQWCYQRLGFDIVLFNTYLRETASNISTIVPRCVFCVRCITGISLTSGTRLPSRMRTMRLRHCPFPRRA